MRIVGQMVMKNEADRYLDACLSWARLLFDEIHCFDDHSTDDSVELALSLGAKVTRRPDDVPPFVANERACRQAAWRAMEQALQLEERDWVFCFDADEFLFHEKGGEPEKLRSFCLNFDLWRSAFVFRVPEVFEVEETQDGFLGHPKVRVDGDWGHVTGIRLCQWFPEQVFSLKANPGSIPVHAQVDLSPTGWWLLHYGYAVEEDRMEKYRRYKAMDNHSPQHVESILRQRRILEPWSGPHMFIWRGPRSLVGREVS